MPHPLEKLSLSKALSEKFDAIILSQIRDAVESAGSRNSLLQDYSDMIEGQSPIQSSARWNDSCDLDFPLLVEAHNTLLSQLISAIRKDLKVMIDAINPDQEEDAKSQERYSVVLSHMLDIDARLAEVAQEALNQMVGIMYAGWEEKTTWQRSLWFRDPDTGDVIPQDLIPQDRDEEEYEPVVRREAQVKRQAELRVPATHDFFLYPANALSIDSAIGVGERMMVSSDTLLLGVGEEGMDYDEEAVTTLIRFNQQTENGATQNLNEEIGVDDPARTEDMLKEIFVWFTKTPVIFDDDGGLETPDYLLGQDLMVIANYEQGVVLRKTYSPYQESRCYIPFYMLPRKNSFYGRCLPDLLYTLQTEVNALTRQFIDGLNLVMSPAWKVKQNVKKLNRGGMDLFPGAQIEVNEMDDVEPFDTPAMDHQGFAQVLGTITTHAEQIYAAGGINSRDNKVRKNQEVQAVQTAAASKYDMFLFFFLKGVEQLFRHLMALYAEHMDDDGEDYLDNFGSKGKITPKSLKGEFLYKSTSTGINADPMSRIEYGAQRQKVADAYNMKNALALQGQYPPVILKRDWHMARELLLDLGDPRPESSIGEEPDEKQFQPAPQPGQPAPGAPGSGQPGLGGAPAGQAMGNGARPLPAMAQ